LIIPQIAYIDTEGEKSCLVVEEFTIVDTLASFFSGTFRPDRIRSIADRFGVDGDMALENILYGAEDEIMS
jgi:hypothetical protein